MSLFGGFMGDDDMFLGGLTKRNAQRHNRSSENSDNDNPMQAMNMQMRSMNRLMNSLMPDPFNMLTPFDAGFQQNSLMERNAGGGPGQMGLFGFPPMPNMNRLLNADIGSPNGASYCSSSVITMSSGPDGRPQIYQATSSTKTGPGGIRETRKTVQDSTRGIKKMAIGHHIGDRAHIIEKEQDFGSGQLEERQEFINLDEEEAEDFDREFVSRAHTGRAIGPNRGRQVLSIEPVDDDDDVIESVPNHRRQMPAILPAPSHHQQQQQHQLPQPHQQQHNSSTTTSMSAAPIISNTTIDLTTSTNDDSDLDVGSTSQSTAMNTNNHNTINTNINNSNNHNYLGGPTRRMYHHRGHHLSAASPRRPLRTPPSSPLVMTPTPHINNAATTLSVHPHPYNVSAARRNHRSKHSKQHQDSSEVALASATAAANGHATNEGKTSPKHSKK